MQQLEIALEESWLLGITMGDVAPDLQVGANALLVDSGREMHVVGKTNVESEGIQPPDRKLCTKSVGGQRPGHHG